MKKKKINILYEDDHCIAIDKPAGILSVPDRYNQDLPNVKHIMVGENPNILIVHRLDKDTSGVLLLAKNPEAHITLQEQFENRTIEKTYVAIAYGQCHNEDGVIEAAIAPHGVIRGKMSINKKGKKAKTHFRVMELFNRHSLIELKPTTGRTHQLRVHLSHMGHTILCDEMYGGQPAFFLSSEKRNFKPNRGQEERPLISRTALHAASLTFTINGESITVESPMHKDMRATINQLRKLV